MKDEYLSVVYSHWISFIHSSIGRHLHWFHNSALLNSATVSTVTQASILPNDVRTSGWIPGARSCWVPWPFFWFVPLSTITLLTRILINRGVLFLSLSVKVAITEMKLLVSMPTTPGQQSELEDQEQRVLTHDHLVVTLIKDCQRHTLVRQRGSTGMGTCCQVLW